MATLSFGDIAAWASNTQLEVAEKSAEIARNTFANVAAFSPYLTGRFVGNWQVGSTSPSYSVMINSTVPNKITEIKSTITDDFFLLNKTAYMVNNVSYAKLVEEDGWRRTGAYAPVAQAKAIFNSTYGGGS